MKRYVPTQAAKSPQRKMDAREAAQRKAAEEKTAARGGNTKPAHRLYPHLD